jgi:geranylgeranyl pyrophosphate synthase
MKKKCHKCDKDGYLKTGKFSRKSCSCGWAIQQQEIAFKKIFPNIEDLLGYAQLRIREKEESN